MPIPKPKLNEKREQFIDRCMADSTMKNEFKNRAQRMAVCAKQWVNR